MNGAGRLQGKTALVTGAAQGLGRALAERLAREGVRVAVADIAAEAAQNTADEIEEQVGIETLAVALDVTDPAGTLAAMESAAALLGGLDIVVSNAGILVSGAVDEIDPAAWAKVVSVNLTGYFNVARAAAVIMKRQGGGVIIQINSKSGKKGSYKNSAYAASKFGGIGLTQSLALELAEDHIRVNAICPGNLLDSPLWVNSLYAQYARRWGISEQEVRARYVAQVPMKRGCTYEDVANVLVFLASDEAAYMTGQAINVTGGQEMN
ncbi:MAG: sorbitol-6-phosphate dehydrogenase [Anaerolineae bacterium]|jgi:sorbitol-6-phosphate 2-dehydrogenase|nr:sorbitol-6-phosphate dehydrogenase [Chloroflexota bacterium]